MKKRQREIVDLICKITHMEAEGNQIFYEANGSIKMKFMVKEEATHVLSRSGKEWHRVRVTPHSQIESYLKGFFGYARVTQAGKLVRHPKNQDVEQDEKPKKPKKSKRPEKPRPSKKKQSPQKVSYGLGTTQTEKAISNAVQDLKQLSSVGKILSKLVLDGFDNESAARVVKEILGKDIKPNDVNKTRRALRRKGLWS